MNAKKSSPEHSELLKVLVIDDERLSSHNLGIQLKFVGEAPLLCSSEQWSDAAASHGAEQLLAVVVGAIRKTDPATLLASIHQQLPAHGILLVTNQSHPDLAMLPPAGRACVQILEEAGLTYETLSAALRKAREQKGVAPRVLTSKIISNTGSALFRSLSGKSRVMQQVRQQLQQVAARDVTVLVLGESGTGKEVVARNLHYHSGRGESPFIAVNCATIAPDRYGVELFGQANGAPGLLERADGGTLYLDEIAELPQNIQTLLLRFLEDKSFHRSGGSELLQANVRVVAGTAQHLQSRIQKGLFRPDLYYRLSLMPIELPPLRKRLSDIPELVQELLKNLESRGYTPISLNAAAIDALQHHKWPGNVRELANLVERLCIMHSEGVIGVNDLPFEYQHAGDTDALLQEIEALTSKVEEKVAVSRAGAHPVGPEYMTAQAATAKPVQAELAPVAVQAAPVQPRPPQAELPAALLPLNDTLLQQYLDHFEKQLVLSALDDCANILSFAAERLSIGEQELTQKMQTHGLESF